MLRKTPGRLALTIAMTALVGVTLAGCAGGAPVEEESADARLQLVNVLAPGAGLSPFSDDAFKMTRVGAFETLVTLDENGELQPGLATAWEQIDESTWRFTPRDGVRFQDGSEMTPEVAAAALNSAEAATPKPRVLDGLTLSAKVDGTDVLVTGSPATSLLPQLLTSPQLPILAPAAYLEDGTVDPLGTGTGPFALTELDGVTSATFDRFDDYWGGTAKLAGVDIDFVTDANTRLAAVRSGTADVVEGLAAGQLSQLTEDQYQVSPTTRTNMIDFNTASGPFADPAIRAAAREAIDVDAIIETAYGGQADRADGLLGPALAWAAPLREGSEYTTLNADRAPAAVVPGGTKITIATFTERQELPDVLSLVAQQLEAVGFTVEQVTREYQYLEEDALSGAFDLFIQSRNTVLDSGDPVSFFRADFSCDGTYNLAKLCDAEVDAALDRADATPPGEERNRLVLLAEAQILATDAVIPFAHPQSIFGVAPGVENLILDPRDRVMVTVDTTVPVR